MEKGDICIYINNYGTSNILIPNLADNNPGMGGTQFEMFLLCQLLKERGIPFTLLLTHPQKTVDNIEYILVKDIDDAFVYCNKHLIKHLILRANDGLKNLDALENTKIIYWIHNFIDYSSATKIAKSKKVERVVFVSQEEADFYYDHDISKKGVVIFNAIPKVKKEHEQEKENIVAFIGDISPYKMLDKLTALWPRIIRKVPDAKLLVLGSGDLYGKGKKFGEFGIAEEQYEKKVLKPLIKHKVLDTVIFQGLVKNNMSDLISRAKITVFFNPIETFCIAATDSIKNKVPVICPKSTGYCDVVRKQTGYLFRNKNQALRKIISVLKNNDKWLIADNDLHYLDNFYSEIFLERWLSLFDNLANQKPPKISHKNNIFVNNKFLVISLRRIRTVFHLPNGFSRIGIKWYMKKLLKRN